MRGIYRHKDNEAVVIFDIKETEIFIPQNTLESDWDNSSSEEALLPNDTHLRIGSNSAELEKCHRPHCPLNLFCSIPFGSNLLQLLVQRELL